MFMLRGTSRFLARPSGAAARKRPYPHARKGVRSLSAYDVSVSLFPVTPTIRASSTKVSAQSAGRLLAFADGACRGNPGPGGCGALIVDGSTQEVIASRTRYIGDQETNNTAEYHGLLLALELAEELAIPKLRVCMDSELIIKQMRGEYRVKAAHLRVLHDACKEAQERGLGVEYHYIPRHENALADSLANTALDEEEQRRRSSEIK